MSTSICPIGRNQVDQLSPGECLTSKVTRIGLLVGGILALGVGATLYFTHVNAIAAYTTGAIGGALLLISGVTCLISPSTRDEKPPHVVVIAQFSTPENEKLKKDSPLLCQVDAEFHSNTKTLEKQADQYTADGTRVIYYYKPDGTSDGLHGVEGTSLYHAYTLCKEKNIPFGLVVYTPAQSLWAHFGKNYAQALISAVGISCWEGLYNEQKIYIEGHDVNAEVAKTNQLMRDNFFG